MQRLMTWRERAAGLLQPLARGVTAVVAAAFGLLLGREIVSPHWTRPVTFVGIGLQSLLILANPVLGLLTWLVISPFGRFTHQVIVMGRGVPDLTLDRLAVGLLVALVLAQLATGLRRRVPLGKVGFFGLLYVVGMGLSTTTSLLNRSTAVQSWFDGWLVPFLIFLLAKNLITNRQDLRAGMHALIISALYLSLLAVREQLTGDIWFYPPDRTVIYTRDVRRVVGLLGNPAFIALSINLAVPLVAYLLVTARSLRRRLVYLVILATLGAGTFMCYNRSGWAGFVVSLLVMGAFSPRFRKYLVPALIAAGVILAVAGAAIVADPRISERLFAQGPIEYRRGALSVAVAMLRDHPWAGVGFSNYLFYYTRYAYWDPHLIALPSPHNSYLAVAVGAGLPVAICYVLMFVFFFTGTWGLYRRASDYTFPDRTMIAAVWGAVAQYLVAGLAMDALIGLYPTMLLHLLMGMVLGAWQGRVIPPLGLPERGEGQGAWRRGGY